MTQSSPVAWYGSLKRRCQLRCHPRHLTDAQKGETPTVSSEEFVAVDDVNVCTAPIIAERYFGVCSKLKKVPMKKIK
ncbi:hypothetical protein TNCV_3600261 [Trichonephila clavipes]|nr:hypothetical protein TNCV_3600261 [Trichonephila clavipes]